MNGYAPNRRRRCCRMNLNDVIPVHPKLEPVLALLDRADHPENRLRCVHIAGTNGKGSTAHLIASALAAAGYRVGLYTSPHLLSPCERIKIITRDGFRCIPLARITDYLGADGILHRADVQGRASFFEQMTALAFIYFAEQQVDYAVIECGLGGELDATNILQPENVALSVITNIGMDHCDLLGFTIGDIARQKAGIIKAGVPLVVGESGEESDEVFLQRAQQCGILGEGLETTGCRIWFADQCGYLYRERKKYAAFSPLIADYEQKNLQTAYVALRALQQTNATIADGFRHVVTRTGLYGRFQQMAAQPLTIFDAGHNPAAVAAYIAQLRRMQYSEDGYRRLHIVFGMVADKDIDAVLRLLPKDACYYFTQPESERALPAAQMAERWQTVQGNDSLPCMVCQSARDALHAAQAAADPEDIIFIGGSFYLYSSLFA